MFMNEGGLESFCSNTDLPADDLLLCVIPHEEPGKEWRGVGGPKHTHRLHSSSFLRLPYIDPKYTPQKGTAMEPMGIQCAAHAYSVYGTRIHAKHPQHVRPTASDIAKNTL